LASARKPVRSASLTFVARSADRASNAGLTATRTATTIVSAACTSTVDAAPMIPASSPARAGPTITARLRLVASTALA
jgi:hypothetical protein